MPATVRAAFTKQIDACKLPYLLNNSAGVHLDRQVNNLALHGSSQEFLLDLISVFKELLDHIVTEHVLHELESIRSNFSEDLLLLIAIGRLELFLDKSRAMLVAAELDYIAVDVLSTWLGLGKSCGPETGQESHTLSS